MRAAAVCQSQLHTQALSFCQLTLSAAPCAPPAPRRHNKGWEEAASSFARQAVRLHTASAALFESAGRTWQDATGPEVEWRLVQIVTPS
jgi:hypothetical protein